MTVHFIGAGPGAADLLTLRAVRLLAASPVCVYAGTYLDAEVLAHCPPGARLVDSQSLDLDAIVAVLAEAHAAGQDVARLCSGDPSIYSALAEQTRRLDRLGIPWDVTPGVPAYAAAAAIVGRELTVPEVAQSVVLTRTQAALDGDAARGSRWPPSPPPAPRWCCTWPSAGRASSAPSWRRTTAPAAPSSWSAGRPSRSRWCCAARWPTCADQVEAAGLRQAAVILVGEALRADDFVESHLYGPRRRD